MKRALLLFLLVGIAYADDPPDNRPPDNRPPHRGGDVDVDVRTPVDVDVNTPVEVGIDAPVNVNTQITRNSQRQVPNAYFSYTPNFIDCGRVLGFQFGNTSGLGSFGVPLPRDKACDMWKAVNEAQENGHILLSYAFMCEIKNIKKVWGLKRCQQITDTAGEWWVALAEGDEETVAEAVARFVPPPDAVVRATEEHSNLEEEIAIQRQQIYHLNEEVEKRTQAYEAVQSKIDQYEQQEEVKQQSLEEFLEELEKREQNE